jgi:chromodomain-helicase-DNA-binding protein 1
MSMALEDSPRLDDDEPQSPEPLQRSDSELSDANDIPTTSHHTSTQLDEPISDNDAMHDMATSDLDADADADANEGGDDDFEEDGDVSGQDNVLAHDVSSSEAGSSSGKRKVEDVDDEEYMKQNPELYGLRRSVSVVVMLRCLPR